jgi:hypothetical protein
MHTRSKTQFIINDKVVHEEYTDLIDSVERLKNILVQELECEYGSIEVKEIKRELGDFDVSADGIIDWRSCYFEPMTGIDLNIKEGTDEYLDAILNGNLEDYLIFVE